MPGYTSNAVIFFVGLPVLNLTGLWFANYFGTLVFLDTIATAMAGLACNQLGFFAGAIVGVLSNLMIAWNAKFAAYRKFLHVNLLCGLAWAGIAYRYPPGGFLTEPLILRYVLLVGVAVGIISAITSVPVRIYLGFHTEHPLDQISGRIWSAEPGLRGAMRIFATESLLSHLLDKTISTTVGLMYVLSLSGAAGADLSPTYHDIIELLAAGYYVAMGLAIKKYGVKFNQDETVALLGPLGFFGVLIALPVIVRSVSAFIHG